ncbi:MAG: glycosyltransferase [Actinomycetia bacterium]|nr:glycosyltransferase [Actinomycetes bacterium]
MSTAERLQRLKVLVKTEGLIGSSRKLGGYARWRLRGSPTKYDGYAAWMKAAENVHPIGTDSKVGFTVIMPVYNTDPGYLSDAVESVLGQTHRNWQLIMVDDASTRQDTKRTAGSLAALDDRITLITRETNEGIAGATNASIEAATHEWIAFMDHDDLLHPEALAWFSTCAADSDLIYSDEDKLDASGWHHSPTWKPDWSSRLLLCMNYINHLTAIRTDVLRDIGGIRTGFDGAQDHDLMLRVSEIPGLRVTHIPHVLYHWRIWSESFSQSSESSLAAERSGLAAVADAIERRGWEADSSLGTGSPFNYRPRFREIEPRPLVKVVIPTRDHAQLLQKCVEGISNRTDGVDVHIVIVDNGSVKASSLEYLEQLDCRDDVSVVRIDDEFNYSALCNRGAVTGPDADYLLMMNNDVEVVGRKWLQQMTGWLIADPAVCVVGTKLVYSNHTVQHGGVVLGLDGVAGHYADHQDDAPLLNNLHDQAREVTAVTGAVLLIRSEDFFSVGGFREELPLVYQDTDLCMRLSRETGGSILYDPTYPLKHVGSATRASHNPEQTYGVYRFQMLWGDELARGDRFYNPHMTRSAPDFSLRELPDDDAEFAARFVPRPDPQES